MDFLFRPFLDIFFSYLLHQDQCHVQREKERIYASQWVAEKLEDKREANSYEYLAVRSSREKKVIEKNMELENVEPLQMEFIFP